MIRIDDLTGATVASVYVTRSGTLRVSLERKRNEAGGFVGYTSCSPLIVHIPSDLRKRKRKKP